MFPIMETFTTVSTHYNDKPRQVIINLLMAASIERVRVNRLLPPGQGYQEIEVTEITLSNGEFFRVAEYPGPIKNKIELEVSIWLGRIKEDRSG